MTLTWFLVVVALTAVTALAVLGVAAYSLYKEAMIARGHVYELLTGSREDIAALQDHGAQIARDVKTLQVIATKPRRLGGALGRSLPAPRPVSLPGAPRPPARPATERVLRWAEGNWSAVAAGLKAGLAVVQRRRDLAR